MFRDINNSPVPFAGETACCSNNEEFFQRTLDYTAGLVRTYAPDGIMMDNNFIPGNLSCRCAACQKKFREYILGKYSSDHAQKRFRVAPDALMIPEKRSALFEEWINWRYHVVHDWSERTRKRLKEIKPDLGVTANTGYGSWHGATEEQFDMQDSIFCETGGPSTGLSIQSRVAYALGWGKPIWFYLCTWKQGVAPMELLDPADIQPMLGATIAHGVNPWIVAYALDIFSPAPQVEAIGRYLRFYREQRECHRNARSTARVALFYSRQTRDHNPLYHSTSADAYRWYNYVYLFNRFAQFLLDNHIPYDILIEQDVEDEQTLARYKTVLAHDAACLTPLQAERLLAFVSAGGCLITTANIGSLDERGGRRRAFFYQLMLGKNVGNNGSAY
ncbi:MAG: beta-galactosidase trimerization domain-containing protein [Lentisphaerae bacterium]|nr:beta-galactosidase trimerization domain-containing protein [Lentisphaerota bacterium]